MRGTADVRRCAFMDEVRLLCLTENQYVTIDITNWRRTVVWTGDENSRRFPFRGLSIAADGRIAAGIANGIDTTVWNPATDPHLVARYGPNRLHLKATNKADVQAAFRLDRDPESLLFCVVSRLTEQKGVDIVLQSAEEIVGHDAQLVVLGDGDAALEGGDLDARAQRLPVHVDRHVGLDEAAVRVLALESERVQQALRGAAITKVAYVQDRRLSLGTASGATAKRAARSSRTTTAACDTPSSERSAASISPGSIRNPRSFTCASARPKNSSTPSARRP